MGRAAGRPTTPGIASAAVAAALVLAFVPAGPRPLAASDPPPAPPAPPATGPIRFRDLSAVSDGPVDFGAPRSTLEKCACAFFDADGDGWDDLVTLAGLGEPFRFFLNRDDGAGGRTFVPAPPGHGLDSGACLARDGSAVTAGDVDGDGDQDLFVGMSWNQVFEAGLGQNALLLNDGTGRFTDVTEAAGLLDGDNTTCAAFLFDFDLDGDLDLFTCNTDFPEGAKEGDGRAHLWRNELKETGALRFTDETELRNVVENGLAVWAATGTDYDGDGHFDLLIGHDIRGYLTQLFRNDPATHVFTDVTAVSGGGDDEDSDPATFGDDSTGAMGIAWGDYDNDGDLDLYLTNNVRNPLYRNNGDGTFAQVARRAGVPAGWITWGCNFEDFDLDGHLDLYVGGGDVWNMARPIVRSFLYRNRGDGTFDEVWDGAGMRHDAPLHREGGTACSDYDRDGRVDLLVTRSERAGASPYLYRNETDVGVRRWLSVSLRGNGRTTNRDAIGARIRIVPRDAAGAAIPGLAQIREINGGDSRGSRSSLVQTFGVGTEAEAADVTVTWPRKGTLAERTATWLDVPLDRVVVIPEDERTAGWRLAAESAAVVAGGVATDVPCSGSGDPDPLTRIVVESGPAWATAGPRGADGVRTLRVEPPDVAEPASFEVTLAATAQGAADPESRQRVRLTVRPRPRIASVARAGRKLVLRGTFFEPETLTVRVDGVPVVPVAATATRLRLVLSRKAALAWGRKKAHVADVTDPPTGATASVRIRR